MSRSRLFLPLCSAVVLIVTLLMPTANTVALPHAPRELVPVWSKIFAANDVRNSFYYLEKGRQLVPTSDGGFVFLGTSHLVVGITVGGPVAVLGRVSKNGELLWSKLLSPNSSELNAGSLVMLPTGEILVAGRSGGFDNAVAWLGKFDGAGNALWERTYRISGGPSHFSQVLVTKESQIALIGERFFAMSEPAGTSGSFLMRVDEQGNVLSEYRLVNSGSVSTFAETADGGFVLAGFKFKPNTPPELGVISFGAVTRLNSQGEVVWQRIYGGDTFPSAWMNAIAPVADGGFIVLGHLSTSSPQPTSNAWLLRLNDDGAIIWQRSYGNHSDQFSEALIPLNGSFIVASNSITSRDLGSGVSEIRSIPWLIKVDSNGDLLWKRQYGTASITFNSSTGFAAIGIASDGALVTMGHTAAFGANEEGDRDADFWMMKLDQDGLLGSSCNIISEPIISVGAPTATESLSMTLTLSLTNSITSNVTSTVFDWALPISSTQCSGAANVNLLPTSTPTGTPTSTATPINTNTPTPTPTNLPSSTVTATAAPNKRFVYVPLVRR